jgi:hypothetical protein
MPERESSQAERERKEAEIAAVNLERQIRQGVKEAPKPKRSRKKTEEPTPED